MFQRYYEKACLSFQKSKNFFGNLKETWLRSRNASDSFYFKAPTVIVYEITGIITRETQLTADSDSGTEGGYQLPESGPPGQSDWFSEKIWRQKKTEAEPNGKAHLRAGLWVVNQHLFWPSTKRGLLWPEESHRDGQPPCHSPRWTPYYTRLYPNTYCLHFLYLLRDRQKCFPEKCLSGQNKPLHSLKAELAVRGESPLNSLQTS